MYWYNDQPRCWINSWKNNVTNDFVYFYHKCLQVSLMICRFVIL